MYIFKKIDFIYINLYNLHLYLLIHLLYVLYSASKEHCRKTVLLSTLEAVCTTQGRTGRAVLTRSAKHDEDPEKPPGSVLSSANVRHSLDTGLQGLLLH